MPIYPFCDRDGCMLAHDEVESCSEAALRALREKLTGSAVNQSVRPVGPYDEPLADWEKDLLYADTTSVVLTRTDGRTVEFHNVRFDSVGPRAEYPGVIGIEFEDDVMRVVHVPFVQSWEFIHH